MESTLLFIAKYGRLLNLLVHTYNLDDPDITEEIICTDCITTDKVVARLFCASKRVGPLVSIRPVRGITISQDGDRFTVAIRGYGSLYATSSLVRSMIEQYGFCSIIVEEVSSVPDSHIFSVLRDGTKLHVMQSYGAQYGYLMSTYHTIDEVLDSLISIYEHDDIPSGLEFFNLSGPVEPLHKDAERVMEFGFCRSEIPSKGKLLELLIGHGANPISPYWNSIRKKAIAEIATLP